MFGILRPCRHTLSDDLAKEWMAHMCGLCLALRDDHGQLSRTATNYDGLVVSVLAAAQSHECASTRRAGRCPLRGMRGAQVANGPGAHLAATVSLMLASAKISDHIEDGDGLYARRGVRALAGRVAEHWQHSASKTGTGLGLDSTELATVVTRQREVEDAAGPGSDVLSVTRPTEEATGEAFAHTAVLAGRPTNTEPLREAGRLFGRIAHLLDAVEDIEQDKKKNSWNPLTATGTGTDRARELCDDALLGVRLALEEVEFVDDRLTRALLVGELHRAVDRVFSHGGHHAHGGRPQNTNHHHRARRSAPHDNSGPHDDRHGNGKDTGTGGGGGEDNCFMSCLCETPAAHSPPKKRGFFAGCAVALFMCCTCQFCLRDPHPGPWSGKPRGACHHSLHCCECCDN